MTPVSEIFVSKFVKCVSCSQPAVTPGEPEAPQGQRIYAAEPEWLNGDLWLRCEEVKNSRGSPECLSRRVEEFNPYPDKLDDNKRIFYNILDFVRSPPRNPDVWGFHPPLYDPLDRKGLTELRFGTYSDVEMERCHWLPVQDVPWTTMPHQSIRFGPDYNAKAGGVIIFKFTYEGIRGVTPLKILDNDVTRILEVYKPRGFTVHSVLAEDVNTAKKMTAFLSQTLRTRDQVTAEGEAVWIFFLGHGGQTAGGQQYILLDYDPINKKAQFYLLDDVLWFLNTFGDGDPLLGKHRIVVWAPCSGGDIEQSQTHRQPPVNEWRPTMEYRRGQVPPDQTADVLEAVANLVKDMKKNTPAGKPWFYRHDLSKSSTFGAPQEDALTQSSQTWVILGSHLGTGGITIANPDRNKRIHLSGSLVTQSLLTVIEYGGDLDLAQILEKVNENTAMTVLYQSHPKDRLTPEELERLDPNDFEAYYGYVREQSAFLSKAHHNRPYYMPPYTDQSAASEQKMTTLYQKWHNIYAKEYVCPTKQNTQKD